MVDGGGTSPPSLGLAAELVRRGHSVSVLGDPTLAGDAARAGCGFLPWRSAPHFDSVAQQTALVAAVEGRNPVRRVSPLRKLPTGSTAHFAEEVAAAARDRPVAAGLAEAAIPGI